MSGSLAGREKVEAAVMASEIERLPAASAPAPPVRSTTSPVSSTPTLRAKLLVRKRNQRQASSSVMPSAATIALMIASSAAAAQADRRPGAQPVWKPPMETGVVAEHRGRCLFRPCGRF